MTESTSVATFLSPADHDLARPDRMLSVGKPPEDVALRIVDPKGREVPDGQAGEVLLSGATIMKGYWKQPEATARAIVDGWYATGDVGSRDEDGYLYLRDRRKDMIISGGENVYSAEVERVLGDCPEILEVAVIGVPDDRWGEAVKAVVVRRAGSQIEAADVIAYARTRLAGFKCPKSADFVDALPRNATGKVLKRTLREPHWKGHTRSVA
jgi:acyl-CoA synthetase (AMP-forming)/AMP-acid ligase II